MNIALICIAKDEDYYIKEWCEYHLKLGFNHIFIYENNWVCQYRNPQLTRIQFNGYNLQCKAYNHFIQTYSKDFDFGLFIDVDEFLVLKHEKQIQSFLEKFKDYLGVGINWKLHGDNRHDLVLKDCFSLVKRFTRSDDKINKHIKTCLNFRYIREHNINSIQFICPHCVGFEHHIISSDLQHEISGPFNEHTCDDALLFHYYCKTKQEYVNIKRKRGFADHPDAKPYKDSDFDKHNLNTISSLNAYNFYFDIENRKKQDLLRLGVQIPTVKDIFDTMEEILCTNKSLCRFGDGELSFLSRETDTIFEHKNDKLTQRLKEILKYDDERVMVSIYRAYLYDDIPVTHNVRAHYEVVEKNAILERHYSELFNHNMIYYSTEISIANHHYNIKRELIEYIYNGFLAKFYNRTLLLVTGDNRILNYKHNILKETSKEVIHIEAPVKNSFDEYDDILSKTVEKAKEYDNDVIVCICLGHTGTVLAYDLSTKYNILAYDIGHLPKEYHCFRMGLAPCSNEETNYLGNMFFAD